jgi:flagellar basal-body rod protein FlgG
MRALSIAATGMQAQQTNVETIANNLANMNTTGFKQQRAEFEDLLYQNVLTPGSQTSDAGTFAPNGIQIGAGVKTSAIYRINTQGDLQSTGNPYFVAVQGAGYFQIQQPDGTNAYTRSGNFSTSAQGQLVTQDGLLVLPGITVPSNASSVTINTQGQVLATVAGNVTPQTVGQLELTVFPNPAGLNSVGSNMFLETPASGTPQTGVPGSPGYGTIQQGYLETSNVNSVDEITALITAQRAYEMNSKVVTAADQMLQQTAQMGGG